MTKHITMITIICLTLSHSSYTNAAILNSTGRHFFDNFSSFKWEKAKKMNTTEAYLDYLASNYNKEDEWNRNEAIGELYNIFNVKGIMINVEIPNDLKNKLPARHVEQSIFSIIKLCGAENISVQYEAFGGNLGAYYKKGDWDTNPKWVNTGAELRGKVVLRQGEATKNSKDLFWTEKTFDEKKEPLAGYSVTEKGENVVSTSIKDDLNLIYIQSLTLLIESFAEKYGKEAFSVYGCEEWSRFFDTRLLEAVKTLIVAGKLEKLKCKDSVLREALLRGAGQH